MSPNRPYIISCLPKFGIILCNVRVYTGADIVRYCSDADLIFGGQGQFIQVLHSIAVQCRTVGTGGQGGCGGQPRSRPAYGRSINPIQTRWTIYARLITKSPFPPPDFKTFLRPCSGCHQRRYNFSVLSYPPSPKAKSCHHEI